MILSNLGDFGDRKGRNLNIFLKYGAGVWSSAGSACLPFGVSAGSGVPALCAILLTLAKLDRIPPDAQPFCPLSRFALVASLANMALFRVLRAFFEGFMGFVWVCVVCVLCVACVAFVRVWS